MKFQLKSLCLPLIGLMLTAGVLPSVQAEVITIAINKQSVDKEMEMPKRGVEMEKVRKIFGEPVGISATVGQPPITRWEYSEFVVHFESDKVIHSVVKFIPKTQDNTN